MNAISSPLRKVTDEEREGAIPPHRQQLPLNVFSSLCCYLRSSLAIFVVKAVFKGGKGRLREVSVKFMSFFLAILPAFFG